MMWGGRFESKMDEDLYHFSRSLTLDLNFLNEEISSNIVYAKALNKAEILNLKELDQIISGLTEIKKNYYKPNWKQSESEFEDIHSSVEAKLYELIGDVAGKLHSGRSRNDLVATDFKLWLKKKNRMIKEDIKNLQYAIHNLAKNHHKTIMSGYTHLQRAQPITLSYHLYSYMEILYRDSERLERSADLMDTCPLGSSAIAGNTLKLDREFIAKELGFKKASEHALDSISDRDHILDFIHVINNMFIHLSRMSEDLIQWSSKEWDFLILPDNLSTGSSLMPQKKNPDLPELIRAKTGASLAAYVSLTSISKGLYTGYHRDFQDDKINLYDLVKTAEYSLILLSKLFDSAKFNNERFEQELNNDFFMATHLAEYLVKKGMPFREAHKLVGLIISKLEKENKSNFDISFKELKTYSTLFTDDVLSLLNARKGINARETYGGCSFEELKRFENKWDDYFLNIVQF
jgi:argininosuccinate lyase